MPANNQEQPNTYFILDQANRDERKRLSILDSTTTASMGGVLPEQPDPLAFERVLDVGCGTGGWLIELAQTLPQATTLIGMDANRTFIEYAREQAREAGVSDRVEFLVADGLRRLEFPDNFFDLVNHRFAWSWLRTWDWPYLLQEYQRVARPGSIVRITEGDTWRSNSPALNRLSDLFLKAMYQSGHTFNEDAYGITSDLAPLLERHGLRQVQIQTYSLREQAKPSQDHPFFENIRLAYQNGAPFLRKWTRVPDDYQQIYRQLLREMQQPDFTVTWDVVTTWGHALSSPYPQSPQSGNDSPS
jgi:ubiquinone/menaquinone biosynthesis C-methylase UbiE